MLRWWNNKVLKDGSRHMWILSVKKSKYADKTRKKWECADVKMWQSIDRKIMGYVCCIEIKNVVDIFARISDVDKMGMFTDVDWKM